jgi:hypothetical protein
MVDMDVLPGKRLRQEFGMQGTLTLAPERGGSPTSFCDMDHCCCPRGRGYFDPLSVPLTEWMPSEEHFPKLKTFGGRRAPGNIRLAHRHCNGLGVGWYRGHLKQRWRAAREAAQGHKDHWQESGQKRFRTWGMGGVVGCDVRGKRTEEDGLRTSELGRIQQIGRPATGGDHPR